MQPGTRGQAPSGRASSTRGDAIAPYWERFHSFFIYPFTFDPLPASLGLTLLGGIIPWLFFPLAVVATLVLTVLTIRLAFRVLEKTALGYLDDPNAMFEAAPESNVLPYKQFAAATLAGALVGLVAAVVGPIVASVFAIVVAALWPAHTMLLAVSHSLRTAIAPGRLWHVVRVMGLPYLGLCGCLLLLLGGAGVIERYAVPRLPQAVGPFLLAYASVYFTLVMYRLMGYAVYQYHDEIGIDVRYEFHHHSREADLDPKARRAAMVAAWLREGDHEQALESARDMARDYPNDIDVHERLHTLLKAAPAAQKELRSHGQRYLGLLLDAQRGDHAVRIAEGLAAALPDFRLDVPERVVPLATAALHARRSDLTARLINGFDRHHPHHPDIPAVYLLGARLMSEHLRDDDKAARILHALRTRFPDHPVRADADKLLQVIERMKALGDARPGTAQS